MSSSVAAAVASPAAGMVKFAIRCHPRAPVSAGELELWLDQQVDHLRVEAPRGTVRLSRLTQGLSSVDAGIGWLLELELPEGDPLLAPERLAGVLRDMRLLGLQPTLLAPVNCPIGRPRTGATARDLDQVSDGESYARR